MDNKTNNQESINEKIEKALLSRITKSSTRSVYSEVFKALKFIGFNNDLSLLILSLYTLTPVPKWHKWQIVITYSEKFTNSFRLSSYAWKSGKHCKKTINYLASAELGSIGPCSKSKTFVGDEVDKIDTVHKYSNLHH